MIIFVYDDMIGYTALFPRRLRHECAVCEFLSEPGNEVGDVRKGDAARETEDKRLESLLLVGGFALFTLIAVYAGLRERFARGLPHDRGRGLHGSCEAIARYPEMMPTDFVSPATRNANHRGTPLLAKLLLDSMRPRFAA